MGILEMKHAQYTDIGLFDGKIAEGIEKRHTLEFRPGRGT